MTPNQLTIDQPNYYRYTGEKLNFDVLGGIELEVSSMMRITLKVTSGHYFMRGSLDLYHEGQLQSFISKLSAKFAIPVMLVEKDLGLLTDALEDYRFKQQQYDNTDIQTISKEDRKKAIDYLSKPNLTQRLQKDISSTGVIGEETNRLVMYLCFTSRKLSQPLSCITYKEHHSDIHLQEQMAELIPEEDVIELDSLSENALYYFGKEELKHKLLLVHDLDKIKSAHFPLVELYAKGRVMRRSVSEFSKGQYRGQSYRVEGPVAIGASTLKENIHSGLSQRSFVLYPDKSPEQASRIMGYYKELAKGMVNTSSIAQDKRKLQNLQRVLQTVSIRNPFADSLELPTSVYYKHYSYSQYLAFIQSITFLHQYQREEKTDTQTGEVYIETTKEDIKLAKKLLQEIFLHKSDSLSGNCRHYFQKLQQYLKQQKKENFTYLEAKKFSKLPETTLRRYHRELLLEGHISASVKIGKTQVFAVSDLENYSDLKQSLAQELQKQ